MKTENLLLGYVSPEVEIVEVMVEQGYFVSGNNGSGEDSDPIYGTWDEEL